MTLLEILRCQQVVLYGSTKMSKLLPMAISVPLSNDFIDWLGQDGFIMNDDVVKFRKDSYDADSDWDCESDRSCQDDDDIYQKSEDFINTCSSINSAVNRLGGEAFPKLNWSSAKDAKWMLGGRLNCDSARYHMIIN